ncbi:LuxR C-terminal-related transcriptional regulator [Candidatus Villigracilis affinis]|uniref:LuxR C-terminal-related transcriptional regulator n=1 Tax=Candidatus Villigracilis affinis TaxID=3140682 RepID=UPI001D936A6B|nr:AAA family ATPase [Anaerolineales bacterium]
MPNTIIKTKINLPVLRRNLVLRKRLLTLLSEKIKQGHKLTLISAPAGFGKTTLVSEWIASGEIPAAWISLDENDSDPSRFLTYLIAALQTLIFGVGDGVLAALQSSQPVAAKDLLTTLLNELSSIEDGFILVLDDFHAIDSKAVDDLLAFLVDHMPPQMHLVITTREDPFLPLARLRARNQLTEIRAAELRFTQSEAADFLNQVMGLNLSAENIAALEARTEGWVAGLQLAALSMQGKADATEFIHSFSGANQFVLDYLLEEVLQKQSESLQGFLLRTSILDRLSGSLCDALWQGEQNSAQEILEQLERANLFVISLDDERRWYRYHHLFRDLLRQRLSQKHSKEEIAHIHIRASEWFEQNGDIGEAFHHAVSAADFDRAARLLETSWQAMDESFQTGTWLGWVNQLPLSVRRVRPVLLTQMGWAYMDAGNAEASEASLRDAETCLKRPLDELVIVEAEQFRTLPARIAFARAYNAQTQNRFDDVVRYVETALDIIPHEDQYMQAQASSILSTTYWASGELDKSFELMSNWVNAAQQAGNIVFAVAASFGKADILITQGRLRDAMQVYQTALSLATEHGAEQHTAHHHLGLGLLHHEMGEDERAAHHLQKAFELGRQTTIADWAYRKSLAQAYLKESEGDHDAALDLLDEAQRYYVRTPIPNLRPVDAMKARIYLQQDRLDKAQAWAAKSGLSLLETPDYLHEFERLTLAKIALAEYQHDQNEQHILDVLKLLEGQLKLAQKQNRLHSQIEILVLQAFALQAKGESAQAISSLEKALSLAEPEGYLRIFVNEGEFLRLLILDVRSAIEKSPYFLFGYVEKLLAEFPQPTELQIQKSKFENPKPELIDPLSDRELEVLRLIAQGLSNQEITQKLVVTLSTVKGHNLRIFAKLQAKSRTEAVARARELGLL